MSDTPTMSLPVSADLQESTATDLSKATVILFKPSGKYYTQEQWAVPDGAVGPWDMHQSKDFHRIAGGSVLVETQDPWGFPHLL